MDTRVMGAMREMKDNVGEKMLELERAESDQEAAMVKL